MKCLLRRKNLNDREFNIVLKLNYRIRQCLRCEIRRQIFQGQSIDVFNKDIVGVN